MENHYTPKILAFLCKWCSYAGADLAGTTRKEMPPSVVPIRVMCSSRVDPLFIVESFLKGSDGILIGGCHPGDCHYQSGNYHTRRRMALLKTTFESLGLEADRLRLSWISASEGPRFASVVTEFTEKIADIGPNATAKEIFL